MRCVSLLREFDVIILLFLECSSVRKNLNNIFNIFLYLLKFVAFASNQKVGLGCFLSLQVFHGMGALKAFSKICIQTPAASPFLVI